MQSLNGLYQRGYLLDIIWVGGIFIAFVVEEASDEIFWVISYERIGVCRTIEPSTQMFTEAESLLGLRGIA